MVEADPSSENIYIARIQNYREFRNGGVRRSISGLKSNREGRVESGGNEVCAIDPDDFVEICDEGGVELSSLGVDVETIESGSGERILEPFDPSKIKVDRDSMSLFQVLRKIDLGEIELRPEFQRNLVWDPLRRSRLIESALLRLPLPAFYFDGVKPSQWTVVDGLQRLSTFRDYVTLKKFALSGMEYLTAAEGRRFDQLPRGMQRELEESQLTLFIVRPETPPEVKFTIFARINTGGLVLTSQEIRHALFQGQSTVLLAQLAESHEFISATCGGVNDSRMEDRECVLRYLGFHLHSYKEYERSDLNGFLSRVMRELNDLPAGRIEDLRQRFLDAMRRMREVFGNKAFRRIRPGSDRRGPVNKALFDSWANVIGEYRVELLKDNKDEIVNRLAERFESDAEYVRALSAATGSKASVQIRFETPHKILRGIFE